MEKLAVHVRSQASSVTLEWTGCEITVSIPASGHTQNVQIQRIVGSWRVNLLHNNPGFGKPYLLNLTNQEKNDEIKISIIPERNFVKTNLLNCTFKSLREFSLTGPNIQAMNSQYDNTPTGVSLLLNSYGNARLKSRPLRVKFLEINVRLPEGNLGSNNFYLDAGADIKCQKVRIRSSEIITNSNGKMEADELEMLGD